MQNSLCDFRQPAPSSLLMYETLCKPTSAIYMACFPHAFLSLLVACNVMYCQTGARHKSRCRFETLIVKILSAEPPCQWCDVNVLNVTDYLPQDFWKSIRCLDIHEKL